ENKTLSKETLILKVILTLELRIIESSTSY
ncbi:MAG: hypothetical protein ACI9K1_001551, partial [Arcticibacterium sp.]